MEQKLEAESKNYEHMLVNMSEEYYKFKSRLSQVKDHKYVMELKQSVTDTKDQISQYQKYLYSLINLGI